MNVKTGLLKAKQNESRRSIVVRTTALDKENHAATSWKSGTARHIAPIGNAPKITPLTECHPHRRRTRFDANQDSSPLKSKSIPLKKTYLSTRTVTKLGDEVVSGKITPDVPSTIPNVIDIKIDESSSEVTELTATASPVRSRVEANAFETLSAVSQVELGADSPSAIDESSRKISSSAPSEYRDSGRMQRFGVEKPTTYCYSTKSAKARRDAAVTVMKRLSFAGALGKIAKGSEGSEQPPRKSRIAIKINREKVILETPSLPVCHRLRF
ncbi:hypothetical protein HK098_003893 [Nowakowskiella sp. JEL0407]|nr:hypothetical protein HK098_003893 [Nowakowskiella sp. JEL0407]